MQSEGAPRQVFVASNPTEAHFVKGLLESAGIRVEMRNEALFAVRGEVPVTPDTLPSLWVQEPDVAQAIELVRDYHSTDSPPESGDEWICLKCGESLEGQFTSCWQCGTDRSVAG